MKEIGEEGGVGVIAEVPPFEGVRVGDVLDVLYYEGDSEDSEEGEEALGRRFSEEEEEEGGGSKYYEMSETMFCGGLGHGYPERCL